MLGSHLDTVPDGGAYDGALGVVAALAVLESWDRSSPICAAAFRAEEATQSGVGRLGSGVFSGVLSIDEARGLAGGSDSDELVGLDTDEVEFPLLFLELHVEQGDRLEAADCSVGAVSGIVGYARWRAALHGRPDHVGTASMRARRDALAAAAEIILEVEQVGRNDVGVATVGKLDIAPNRVGVVPAHAELIADIRALDDSQVDQALTRLHTFGRDVSARRGVRFGDDVVSRAQTVHFPEWVVDGIERAARVVEKPIMRVSSGANHDASNLARICPAGMVFVPSQGGRSHTPDEYTSPIDCQTGAHVLGWAARLLSARMGESLGTASGSSP
jgi:hydantoinase/carbamoylase family amidase